jgi:hypothetical protein
MVIWTEVGKKDINLERRISEDCDFATGGLGDPPSVGKRNVFLEENSE